MTREQQKKIQELKKAVPVILKEEIKAYKIKKKDYMIWYQKKDLFFDAQIDIKVMDGILYCETSERMKPMWMDDLLWDLFDMEGNKKEPASLRAVGAFSVYGAPIHAEKIEMKSWEIDELRRLISAYVEHFWNDIQTLDMDSFYACMEKDSYQCELRRYLCMVYEGRFEEVIEKLKNDDHGNMCNGNLWVNDAIGNYCRAQQQFVSEQNK